MGITDTGRVFILVGTSRINLTAYVDFSGLELRELKEERTVALMKTDPIGWELKGEVLAVGSVAQGNE